MIIYEMRITFEDNTRVNFTGEGIKEIIPGSEGVIRLRHTKLINDVASVMREYMNQKYVPVPEKTK